jgi:hypothetical protein
VKFFLQKKLIWGEMCKTRELEFAQLRQFREIEEENAATQKATKNAAARFAI